jgi:hypothetical protein
LTDKEIGTMGFFKKLFGREDGPPQDIRRNDPCWCGSGKKYKRCCLESDSKRAQAQGTTCTRTT